MLHITGHFTHLNRFHIECSPLFDNRFNIFTGGRHFQSRKTATSSLSEAERRHLPPVDSRQRVTGDEQESTSQRTVRTGIETVCSPVNVLLMTLLEIAVYDRLPAELLYNALRPRQAQERTNKYDSILAEIFQSIFLPIATVWLFLFSLRSVIIDQRRGKPKSIQTKHRLVEGDLFWKKNASQTRSDLFPIRK